MQCLQVELVDRLTRTATAGKGVVRGCQSGRGRRCTRRWYRREVNRQRPSLHRNARQSLLGPFFATTPLTVAWRRLLRSKATDGASDEIVDAADLQALTSL
jgi:hypothetical protein